MGIERIRLDLVVEGVDSLLECRAQHGAALAADERLEHEQFASALVSGTWAPSASRNSRKRRSMVQPLKVRRVAALPAAPPLA